MCKVVLVPYRPVRFYRKYGAVVREYKMALSLHGFDVYIIDEVGLWRQIEKGVFKLIEINICLSVLSFKNGRRIWLAERLQRGMVTFNKKYNFDFCIINHPLVYGVLDGVLQVRDIIDNFGRHIRFTMEERRRFYDVVSVSRERQDPFTVVSKKAALSLRLTRYRTLDNYPINVLISDLQNERSGLLCVGFYSDRIDWNLIYGLDTLGVAVHLYGEFFDKTERRIKHLENVKSMGVLVEKEKDIVFSRYKAMLVPYLSSTEHDGSPVKAYDALARGLPIMSTIDYDICSKNIHKVSHEKDVLDLYDGFKWVSEEPMPAFEGAFLGAMNDLLSC